MLDYLLCSTCVICDCNSQRKIDLCARCENSLPWLKKCCYQCALPLTEIGNEIIYCGQCTKQKPSFNRTTALFHYELPIDYFITQLKFQHKLIYAKLIGNLLLPIIKDHYKNDQLPELIVPVPLHKKRLRERGFNQSLEIARILGKGLKIPINTRNCIRYIATPPQSSLPAKQRKKNIRNAFLLVKPIHEKFIVIVDDVITTANTVEELAKTLKKGGAKRVDVWCCARTLPRF